MFFGSGNLVFPIEVGTESVGAWGAGVLGILLSGIGMPILGMVSILICGGDTRSYMQRLGKPPALLLMFIMLALMGPFGVGARCLLVAHGGVALLWPGLAFFPFALVFGSLATLFAWRRRYVIEGIGRILTPLLLAGIVLLFVFGLGAHPPQVGPVDTLSVFKNACIKGYEMMDLLAAFFFSATVAGYLNESNAGEPLSNKQRLSHAIGACLVGALLLALVYVGFVSLGAQYALQLQNTSPTAYLPTIAGLCLGRFALPVASITIALACLTTLIVLIRLFAHFLEEDLTQGRLPARWALLITLACTLLTACIGFDALSTFLAKALSIAYPALAVFAAFSIFDKFFKKSLSPPVFWLALAVSAVVSF